MRKYLYFILPLICMLLYQLTKFLIVNVSNTGVAFSMFQNNNIFFIALVSLLIIYFIIKNKTELTKLQTHSLLLILACGITNLIDMVFSGAVVDFIDTGYKNVYRWSAFNIADSSVCICVTLFIISLLFFNKKSNEQN